MKAAQDIILAPVITEKSMAGAREFKQFTFKVAKDAGKVEIARVIEELFKVQVEKVRTMHVRGQMRRMGAHQGYTPSWKKAIVTLTESSKNIEFFEGMM